MAAKIKLVCNCCYTILRCLLVVFINSSGKEASTSTILSLALTKVLSFFFNQSHRKIRAQSPELNLLNTKNNFCSNKELIYLPKKYKTITSSKSIMLM